MEKDKSITSRPFRVLADCGKVYQFLIDIYEKDWRNGVPAPFFEYAYSSFSYWMDISYSYKNRIWESDGRIVAFCFYENPLTDIYFCLRPGYGELAQEMIQYAAKNMPDEGEGIRLVLFGGQDELMESAKRLGYRQESESWNMQFDFVNKLDYPLPEGFHFVSPQELDTSKVGECCWKGFDHEQEEGAWNHQYQQNFYLLEVAPHATKNLSVAVANEEGAYVCWAGMWWTPENKLAYLEPLCTIPEYRRKGLAAAALSELYRKTKALGATHMSGGESEFYRKIGYIPAVKWTFWKKETKSMIYNNPWNEIALTDYERHMSLASIMQLQALNKLIKGQLKAWPVSSTMILGIAGGNGLEHIRDSGIKKVYGVDINAAYLSETSVRYQDLGNILELLCIDLHKCSGKLPGAELLIANLLVEYIGCGCFRQVVQQVEPIYVSCVIQVNTGVSRVSDSPYLHVFDGLKRVYHQIDADMLRESMPGIGYRYIGALEYPLPNGKKLVRLDFKKGSMDMLLPDSTAG